MTMTQMTTVHELRKAGNKVRVMHWRVSAADGRLVSPLDRDSFAPKGGKTQVEITTGEGQELMGIAECSKKDPFNRKLGLSIALGRALTSQK